MAQGTKRYQKGKLYELPITELRPDPDQPRKFMDEQALAELETSVVKHGVLQPILARRTADGSLMVVSGERRYQASLQAGLATVPVLITDGNPVELSIVENLLREDLTAVEEAEAIDRLKNQHNYQLADLSAVLGKGESTLCEILSINKLPDEVKDECRSNPKAARYILAEIAKQRDDKKMIALYEKYKENGLTRGKIRRTQRLTMPKNPTFDISFLGSCVRKLAAIEVAKLELSEISLLTEALGKLQSAAQTKLEALKPPPAP